MTITDTGSTSTRNIETWECGDVMVLQEPKKRKVANRQQ